VKIVDACQLCSNTWIYRVSNSGVEPGAIEDTGLVLSMVRQKKRVPPQAEIRREVGVDPEIIMHVERRDVHALVSDLAVVLRERARLADHKISQGISGCLAVEGEVAVHHEAALGVQL